MQFTKLTVPDSQLDGDFVQCWDCSAVIETAAQETHVCEKPQSREEMYTEALEEAMEVMQDSNASERAKRDAFDKWDLNLRRRTSDRIDRVNRKYGSKLRQMIDAEFLTQIEYARKQQKREYDKNDDLRAKGVPFGERQKLINKERIAFMARQEARLLDERARFVPQPLYTWFDDICYDLAVKHGMAWVIKINFSSTYVLATQSNYEQENY